MSLENTVFTFKISITCEERAGVYESQENIQMNKERGINCLYKGVKKDDPTSVILIEQGEEGKSIAMFQDPAVKPLIESAAIFMIRLSYQVIFKFRLIKLLYKTIYLCFF